MLFIGVRISWLMFDRKSLLARFAREAARVASSSAWVRCWTVFSRFWFISSSARSARTRSVISVRMAMYCSGRPFSSSSGTMVALTQYSSPAWLRLQISPCQTWPAPITFHRFSKKLAGCRPELMMRWLRPSSSSRV